MAIVLDKAVEIWTLGNENLKGCLPFWVGLGDNKIKSWGTCLTDLPGEIYCLMWIVPGTMGVGVIYTENILTPTSPPKIPPKRIPVHAHEQCTRVFFKLKISQEID